MRPITSAITSARAATRRTFLKKFQGAYSQNFDPDVHLVSVGVANQTTMMKGETEEVQRRFERAMVDRYGRENLETHFQKADTICGATQERQDALSEMLGVEKMNLLLVVGGYNSSNTSHLAEMGEAVLPTYFIKNSDKLISAKEISHYDQHKQQEVVSHDWLPEGNVVVGITAGASCPNNSARGNDPAPVRIPRHQCGDAAAARLPRDRRPGADDRYVVRASLNS